MTRPVIWRRSTAKERRHARAEGRALRAAWEASPERAAMQARNRAHAAAHRARQKLRLIMAGDPAVRPLTAVEMAAMSGPSKALLATLTAKQRRVIAVE